MANPRSISEGTVILHFLLSNEVMILLKAVSPRDSESRRHKRSQEIRSSALLQRLALLYGNLLLLLGTKVTKWELSRRPKRYYSSGRTLPNPQSSLGHPSVSTYYCLQWDDFDKTIHRTVSVVSSVLLDTNYKI